MKTQKLLLMVLALVLGCVNVSAQKRFLKTENNGYQWYEIYNDEISGVEGMDGKVLIPLSRGYNTILFEPLKNGMGYFTVIRNKKYGVCDITGREIIAPNKYDFVNYNEVEGHVGYYSVSMYDKGGVGACDITGKEIIPCRYDEVSYSDCFTYKKTYDGANIRTGIKLDKQVITKCSDPVTKKDYFIVEEKGQIGINDTKCHWTISPNAYSSIESIGGGYVRLTQENGLCSVRKFDGQEVIPVSRGYTYIGNYNSSNKRFSYTMDGYRGECDATGRQISKIKVKTPSQNYSVASVYHDVVAFELKGNVKRCELDSKGVSGGYVITFDKTGKLASIGKLGDETIYDIKHSEKGYLISFKSSDDMIKHREYFYSNNKLTKTKLSVTAGNNSSPSLFETMFSAVVSSMFEFDRVSDFFYSNNNIVKCISITKDSEKEEKDIFIYSNYKYDKHGNWISRLVKENGESYIEKRIIEYY